MNYGDDTKCTTYNDVSYCVCGRLHKANNLGFTFHRDI